MTKFLAGKIFGRKIFFFNFFRIFAQKTYFLYKNPKKNFFPFKPLRKILRKISGTDFGHRFLSKMGSIESWAMYDTFLEFPE